MLDYCQLETQETNGPETDNRPTFHVFLVEDNAGDVFLLREALRQHHLSIKLQVVSDGATAIDHIRRLGSGRNGAVPDLFILDFNLPAVNGDRVVEEIRRTPRCADVPVLIVTSSEIPKVARLHADAFFQKPANYRDYMKLGEIVKGLLEHATVKL
jgi:CheY-like chemotaxis protein